MGQKTSNVLSWILLIIFVFLIGVSFFLIKREGEIADQIAELKEIYLCSEQASDLNMVYFDKYITNQNELKSLWWNTIINQGGLSIIFTVVVIVVTGSISFMTQNNIENQYKKNIEEGKQKLKDSILDVSCILNQHKGTFGAYMISDEAEESHLFACIIPFNIVLTGIKAFPKFIT
ncbi:hypothetical protein FACS1894147_13250 [Spirochaetia bacterium]|nr:hypothetical protein FACS1894147_13250 [Spirochaetia bacterium]